ncbi:SH3 domain-containing protein [Sinorhizobium americanum]|uniref:SH3b domain-containing protein n=1 Tax=Sinorhizobium americanum TaxID=194963 RepID=A0A4V2RFF7_9HYPH|nr:SH3 domain-containing protein [Sinorhizobium americanum]TCN32480.1 hypothetical protein EV184_104146 [Sinorhizobium americanum]
MVGLAKWMRRSCFASAVQVIVFLLTEPFPAYAQSIGDHCVVNDPTTTDLNVRLTPRGKKIGTVPNGAKFYIQDIRDDDRFRPWARIDSGWVFLNYMKCTSSKAPSEDVALAIRTIKATLACSVDYFPSLDDPDNWTTYNFTYIGDGFRFAVRKVVKSLDRYKQELPEYDESFVIAADYGNLEVPSFRETREGYAAHLTCKGNERCLQYGDTPESEADIGLCSSEQAKNLVTVLGIMTGGSN